MNAITDHLQPLACEKLGSRAADGSHHHQLHSRRGIIPPLTGVIADVSGICARRILPALCYAIIAGFR
jgi:hypothetical protein